MNHFAPASLPSFRLVNVLYKSRRMVCGAGWELRLESTVANDTHLVYV
jgi:hypothetical protein